MWITLTIIIIFMLGFVFMSYMQLDVKTKLSAVNSDFYKLESTDRNIENVLKIFKLHDFKFAEQNEHSIKLCGFNNCYRTGDLIFAKYKIDGVDEETWAMPLNVIDGLKHPEKGVFFKDESGMIFALCF